MVQCKVLLGCRVKKEALLQLLSSNWSTPSQDGASGWQSHLATADEAGPLPNPASSERFPPEHHLGRREKRNTD